MAKKQPPKPEDPKQNPEKAASEVIKRAQTKAAKKKAKPPKAVEAENHKAEPQAPDEDAGTQDGGDLCGLSIRAARFIDIYLFTFNATRAYVEAGYTAKNTNVAAASASALLSSPKGRAYLAKRSKAMLDRAEEEQDKLMRTLTFTAYADANELVSHRIGCCRYCWGTAYRYQYTAGEWEQALLKWEERRTKAIEAKRPDPGEMDAKGGTGFLKSREPNPDCPECCGEGDARIVFKDTEKLSPAALALYAGTERTKDGVKVNMHSQEKAREMLAKVRKLYEDNTKVNVEIDFAKLDAEFGEVMRKAHERAAELRRERFGGGNDTGAPA